MACVCVCGGGGDVAVVTTTTTTTTATCHCSVEFTSYSDGWVKTSLQITYNVLQFAVML